MVNCLTTDTGQVLPETHSNVSLAENFSRFFDSKIDTLRNDHFSQTNIDVVYTDINRCNSSFTAFNEVTLIDVYKLINKSSNKSCFSDPIPTFVVKSCLDTLLIHLVHIINTSLLTAVFPKLLKQSLITPLKKNYSLEVNELSNYRPIAINHFYQK